MWLDCTASPVCDFCLELVMNKRTGSLRTRHCGYHVWISEISVMSQVLFINCRFCTLREQTENFIKYRPSCKIKASIMLQFFLPCFDFYNAPLLPFCFLSSPSHREIAFACSNT